MDEKLVDLCKAELWSRRRWDEPPQLYFVYNNRLRPMHLPTEVWGLAPTVPEVLETLADGSARPAGLAALAGATRAGLLGFALRNEGWYAEAPSDTRPQASTWGEMGGRPSQRPDRVEMRMMYLATTTGYRHICMQRRDQGYQVEVFGPKETVEFGGTIPDALAMMVHSLLAANPET